MWTPFAPHSCPGRDSSENSQRDPLTDPLRSGDGPDSPSNETQEIQSSQENSFDEYEWPSEASRYRTVAASNELLALTAPSEAKQNPNIIKVGATHISPCGMAQYRTSTLHVLISHMRHHHESRHDGLASSYSGDSRFWEGLFIDLDRSWNLTSVAQLEHRFSWVLELTRTGRLPAQASVASDILQKRLCDSVFLKETHPYNYEIQCSTLKFLNPDLSPEWTKAFLAANDALFAVERDIQKHMDGYNLKGFCSMYGVLIIHLWERAMADQGHSYPGLALARPRAATFARPQTSEASAVQDDADEPDDPALGSPPPYPPLSGHPVTRRSTLWEDQEIDYLNYLMELSISQKEMLAKFHRRFGENRTLQALATQIKLLRRAERVHAEQDTLPLENTVPTYRDDPVQPEPPTSSEPIQQQAPTLPETSPVPDISNVVRPRGTASRMQSAVRTYLKDQANEKREHLRTLLPDCDGWDQVTSAMKEKFGPKGSKQVFQMMAKGEKMDTSRVSARKPIRWSAQEHTLLESLLQTCNTWQEIHTRLEAESPKDRHVGKLQTYATIHNMDVSRVAGPSKWTLQEDNILREFFNSGVPRPEYPTRFWERVGEGRSRGAIVERTQRLGLLANKSWTEAEISNVRENYYLALKPFCAQFWEKFGYDRTRKTLQIQRRKQNPANAEN